MHCLHVGTACGPTPEAGNFLAISIAAFFWIGRMWAAGPDVELLELPWWLGMYVPAPIAAPTGIYICMLWMCICMS